MARRNSKTIPTVLTQDDFIRLDKSGRLDNFGGYRVLTLSQTFPGDFDGDEGDEPEDEELEEEVCDTLEDAVRVLDMLNTWDWSVHPAKAAEIDTTRVGLIGVDDRVDYRTGDQTSYTAFVTKLDEREKSHKLNTREVQFLIDNLTAARRFRREV